MSEELTTALLTAWPNIPPLVAKRLTTEPPSDDDEAESMSRERTIARVKELLR